MKFHSPFDDIADAFEEMEFLAKTTGRTHRLYAKKKGYRVVEATNKVEPSKLIAELNCRNIVGEEEINHMRGHSLKKRVTSSARGRKVV